MYLVWDGLTKWPLNKTDKWARVAATAICLILAYFVRSWVQDADPPHVLTADFALLALVLLFRALKGLASALFPTETIPLDELRKKRGWAFFWSVLFALGILLGTEWTTQSWPLPRYIAEQIQTLLPGESNHAEAAGDGQALTHPE
jgi:uncharacterized membrane protein YfcA